MPNHEENVLCGHTRDIQPGESAWGVVECEVVVRSESGNWHIELNKQIVEPNMTYSLEMITTVNGEQTRRIFPWSINLLTKINLTTTTTQTSTTSKVKAVKPPTIEKIASNNNLNPRAGKPVEEGEKLRKYIPSQKLIDEGIRNVILLKDTEDAEAGSLPACDWRIHFESGVQGSCEKENSEVGVYMRGGTRWRRRVSSTVQQLQWLF